MIGILGGTFDPIHNAHLRTAMDVKEQLGLTQVRIIPLKQAVHRMQPTASPEQRAAMVNAAITDWPGFVLDERELERKGNSYTVDTLRSLRAELADEPICWLLGRDAFNHFLSWHRYQEILKLAHLVVMARPGEQDSSDPRLHALIEQHRVSDAAQLHQQPAGLILFQSVSQFDLSATRIRGAVAQGQTITQWVPKGVATLIKKERLYRA